MYITRIENYITHHSKNTTRVSRAIRYTIHLLSIMYLTVFTDPRFRSKTDMKTVGLLLLLFCLQIHLDQCFRLPSPIHYYVRTFKRVQMETEATLPTTTTIKSMPENLEKLMTYQKAFAEAVKEIRKHIDGETEDSAKIGSILQDLKINRLMI